jgi:ubiquitin-activating enzyme E1
LTSDFKKDDVVNDHVAFVNAASSLSAISYGIPPAGQMETQRVASNMIPAMITTTALVSGFSCIELLKLA